MMLQSLMYAFFFSIFIFFFFLIRLLYFVSGFFVVFLYIFFFFSLFRVFDVFSLPLARECWLHMSQFRNHN